MFALATLSLVDSVCFMIVTPSLAFYVSSLGGSQDFYVSYWQYTHSLRFVASPFLDDGGKLVLHIVYLHIVYYVVCDFFLLPPPSLHLFAHNLLVMLPRYAMA